MLDPYQIVLDIVKARNRIEKEFSPRLAEKCAKDYFVTLHYGPHINTFDNQEENGLCIIIDTLNKQGNPSHFMSHTMNVYRYLNNLQHFGEFLN